MKPRCAKPIFSKSFHNQTQSRQSALDGQKNSWNNQTAPKTISLPTLADYRIKRVLEYIYRLYFSLFMKLFETAI